MIGDTFFDEPTEQSKVKATIVSKYFWAWAKVISSPSARIPVRKLAYVDLFAGRGCYKDGTQSTPLLVLAQTIGDPSLRSKLASVFNDSDSNAVACLKDLAGGLQGIETLAYAPRFTNYVVGSEILGLLKEYHGVPKLVFADPWGYKGLTLDLIDPFISDWGSDCIIFFNYNRINPGLHNPTVSEHMNALFGEQRAERLRNRLKGQSPSERELAIVEEICQALHQIGARYVLPFRFLNDRGTRTKHHLVFATKHFKGYEIMKEIMASESSLKEQGVPGFEYSPASAHQPLLFELNRPLDELAGMLLKDFAGRNLTMQDIYMEHNIGKRYIKKNYKDILLNLEASGRVTAYPPREQRRRTKGVPTMADVVRITFPAKEAR